MDLLLVLIMTVLGLIAMVFGRKGKNGYALGVAFVSILIAVLVRGVFDGVSIGLMIAQAIGFFAGMALEIRSQIETSVHVREDVLNQLTYGDNEPTVRLDDER